MSDPGAARLLLVRHGETVWHAANRYAGAASDIDLTPRGHTQAEALARWSAGQRLDGVVCSPVRRAVETATPSALATGLPLQLVAGLREVGFGSAEGRTLDELRADDPGVVERFRADPVAHPFPGAEPPAAAADRAVAALRALAAQCPGGRVLVVAHNTLLRLALCALLELPLNRYRQVFPRLDNAAVTELVVRPDAGSTTALLGLNVPTWTPGGDTR